MRSFERTLPKDSFRKMASVFPAMFNDTCTIEAYMERFKFKNGPESPLFRYLRRQKPSIARITDPFKAYRLAHILMVLLEAVQQHELEDKNFPGVIQCNKDLEKALSVKTFLLVDLIGFVKAKMTPSNEPQSMKDFIIQQTARGMDQGVLPWHSLRAFQLE